MLYAAVKKQMRKHSDTGTNGCMYTFLCLCVAVVISLNKQIITVSTTSLSLSLSLSQFSILIMMPPALSFLLPRKFSVMMDAGKEGSKMFHHSMCRAKLHRTGHHLGCEITITSSFLSPTLISSVYPFSSDLSPLAGLCSAPFGRKGKAENHHQKYEGDMRR